MDLELALRAVRDKEDAATQRLGVVAADHLYAFIRGRGVSPDDAEDLVQEVLIVALANLPGLEHPSLCAWLFKVAANRVAEHRRKVERRHETRLSRARDLAAPACKLSSERRHRDQEAKLTELIEQLNTPLREVAQLDREGGDPKQYAKRANIAPSTVSTRRKRYRDWVRKHLSGD